MNRTKMSIDTQFDRIERILKWLVVVAINERIDERFIVRDKVDSGVRKPMQFPDITDIME